MHKDDNVEARKLYEIIYMKENIKSILLYRLYCYNTNTAIFVIIASAIRSEFSNYFK